MPLVKEVAEQLRQLHSAKAAVSGTLVTPARQNPYLEVFLLSIEGKLYWRPASGVFEFVSEGKSTVYRTKEDILRDFRVRGFVPFSG